MSTKVRLYFSEKIQSDLISHLTEHQSHYVKDVMRLKVGDGFSIFNEQGEWNAVIENYKKGYTNIKILAKVRNKENEKNIWLAFSPIRSNYFNFMIQKATELGVTKFLPIIFDRTIVRKINNERLKKIIIEASEQSNRINIPSIEKAQNLKNFLSKYKNKIDLIFTDLNTENKKLDIKKVKNIPICIIIGPEGDFSEKERKEILTFEGVKPIKINENILRSETAAISTLSIIIYCLNL